MKKILLLLIALHTILLASTPNECDILAADPSDPNKPTNVKGVSYLDIDSAKAIKACLKAIKDFPNEPRYKFQLSRALKDSGKAFDYLSESANQGYPIAQFNFGFEYYRMNIKLEEGFKWFMKSAEQGYDVAQYQIADMYMDGNMVEKSYKKAFEWYLKSAEQGNEWSQRQIGVMYENGDGVIKSYKKAFKWYLKAAKQGDKWAQLYLGLMYENGNGVKKNYIRAYAWFNLASSNGLSYASKTITELETKMTKLQIAIAQEYNPLDNKKKSKAQDTIGTGFFVSSSKVLTNNHVINSCKSIELVRKGYTSIAKIIAKDVNNDLAILEADTVNSNALKFRTGKGIRIGNEIVVLGYPLGDVLGTSVKLTTGNVSSLNGLVDDTTRLQMSAPVQPGNSGGPLLDTSGNIVGVVYARLEKSLSGRLTQNVNLAIKANVAKMFLDSNNVDYAVEPSNNVKDLADIADEAKESIVKIICHQ